MKENSYYSQIKEIIKNNGGYITRTDINKNAIPSAMFYEYIAKHNLIKYGTGFYAEQDWIKDDYFVFQYNYPKLIYSFYSAQYLNELGDFNPPFLEVTAPKNYRPFPLPKKGIRLHTDTKDDTYWLGITEVKSPFGNIVRVYDNEKTVCDFVKNRNKVDSELFVKCIYSYRCLTAKNINKLIGYSKKMKIEDEINSLMEVVLYEK